MSIKNNIIKIGYMLLLLTGGILFAWVSLDHMHMFHIMKSSSVIDDHNNCKNTEYVAYLKSSDTYVSVHKCPGLNDLPEGSNHKHH